MTGLSKIIAAAVREYRATALTWAFFLGAVVFPAVIWGAILLFSVFAGAIAGEREPLRGTIAVYDRTENNAAVAGIRDVFDPQAQVQRRLRQLEQLRETLGESPMAEQFGGENIDALLEQAQRRIEDAPTPKVEIEPLDAGADLDAVRGRVRSGDRLALVVVDERTLRLSADSVAEALREEVPSDDEQQRALPGVGDGAGPLVASPDTDSPPAGPEEGDEGERSPGEYEVYHTVDLDPEYLEQIEDAVHRAVQDERYRRLGIDPDKVLLVAENAPESVARLITRQGNEAESAAGLQRFLPFAFLFLMYGAVFTGGQYLLMGTIEEKQSRVMEVLLSAVSPWQLLVGKMIGQAAVGGTIFLIYGGVGLSAASTFGVLGVLPRDPVAVAAILLYFVMAYLFLGAMMTAIGAAVTEYREVQAFNAPIVATSIVPFLLLFLILENPESIIGRVFSYVPPTTPFVMVMRLSNPAYPVPIWEILLTQVVGFAGVIGMVMLAARIFRVGVLSYGKPPSLLGLIGWARQG